MSRRKLTVSHIELLANGRVNPEMAQMRSVHKLRIDRINMAREAGQYEHDSNPVYY